MIYNIPNTRSLVNDITIYNNPNTKPLNRDITIYNNPNAKPLNKDITIDKNVHNNITEYNKRESFPRISLVISINSD